MAAKFSEDLRQQVAQRAKGLCEYCHASEQWQYVRFTVDHVMPLAQGGLDSIENLALACFHCNRKKGANSSRTSVWSSKPSLQSSTANLE